MIELEREREIMKFNLFFVIVVVVVAIENKGKEFKKI